ncbi:hypothetical protein [Streptomyces sp. URMC 129]|uniref:hypothetical protein n=1 Tax=Streptomyces sp. URMC 129 TaxID=3423407 RepID=UPI003F1A1E12
MAAPDGATSVAYTFQLSEGNPDLEQTYVFPVGTGSAGGDLRDALARVAADAMRGYLEAAYPNRAVYASRTYQGAISGTPWPPAEEE